MNELVMAIAGNDKATEQFQIIIKSLGSCMNVGEIKFKSCIFSAQVNIDVTLILKQLGDSLDMCKDSLPQISELNRVNNIH